MPAEGSSVRVLGLGFRNRITWKSSAILTHIRQMECATPMSTRARKLSVPSVVLRGHHRQAKKAKRTHHQRQQQQQRRQSRQTSEGLILSRMMMSGNCVCPLLYNGVEQRTATCACG